MSAILPVLLKWIHLMATVAWIGGMFTNFFIVLPSVGKTLEPPLSGKLLAAVMKRFRVMVYSSMLVFLVTGIAMGSLHLGSDVFFPSGNAMVAILLIKIPLYLVMVILAVVAFEVVAPRVARISAEGPSPRLQRAQKSQRLLALTGFILGVLVIAVSAIL